VTSIGPDQLSRDSVKRRSCGARPTGHPACEGVRPATRAPQRRRCRPASDSIGCHPLDQVECKFARYAGESAERGAASSGGSL